MPEVNEHCFGAMSHAQVKHGYTQKTDRQTALAPVEQLTGLELDLFQAEAKHRAVQAP